MNHPGHNASRAEWAQYYKAQRWAPIPVPERQKDPNRRGWQKLRIEESDLERYFGKNSNIGLLLGEPSQGLTDTDLDVPEAVLSNFTNHPISMVDCS